MNAKERTAVAARAGGGNRRSLLLSLTPLAIPISLALFSLGQRAVQAVVGEPTFGRTSPAQARRIARDFCARITGPDHDNHISDMSQQTAFSQRRKTTIREWNVVCSDADHEYLLRINADTRQVFGVNRTRTLSAPTGVEGGVSQAEAEDHAKRYLGMIGVASADLQPTGKLTVKTEPAPAWNFTYRYRVPGIGKRILTVSVDSRTGDLLDAWNPASAF